jgi:hypothetical protein
MQLTASERAVYTSRVSLACLCSDSCTEGSRRLILCLVRVMTTHRVLRWSVAGAVIGFGTSVGSVPLVTLGVSVLVGAVTGAVAGAAASVPATACVQALTTGAAAGLCWSVLSYYLVGSSRSVVSHVAVHTCATIVSFLILRIGVGEHRGERIWANPPKA